MASVFEGFLTGSCLVLVALTVWESGRGWLRYRDRHRVDLISVIALLAAILLFGNQAAEAAAAHPQVAAWFAFLFLLQPFFLLRLVHRFRHVPAALLWATLAAAVAGGLFMAATPGPVQPLHKFVVALYFLIQLAYASWAFGAEARRSAGVTASRLHLAAIGTWLHVAIAVIVAAEALRPDWHPAGAALRSLIGLGVFACYYAGLVAPRGLRAIWARRELYRHVVGVANRAAGDRVTHASDDLLAAATRGVASTAGAVLLFDEREPAVLGVTSATHERWSSARLAPEGRLVGHALARGIPAQGTPEQCEGPLSTLAKDAGRNVWVMPIATGHRQWGALIVVQHHGSLFPEDDVAFLEALCQQTATTLEQGRLEAVEREHIAHVADVRVKESEARFGRILASLHDLGVVSIDEQGRVTAWQGNATALFGWPDTHIVGLSCAPLFGGAEALAGLLREARTTTYVAKDLTCHRADGTTFPASVLIQATPVEDGQAGGFIVIARDETERQLLAERLRHSQKLEAVGQLAGGVAHDFNNLLMSVLGYLAEIERHPGYDRALDDSLVQIRNVAERASALTRRLLAFSRQQIVQPKMINLPEVVTQLVPMLERLMTPAVHLEFNPGRRAAWMLADPIQIEQIVLNLAINARDAMPDGGRLSIAVGVSYLHAPKRVGDASVATGTYATLTVEDTGVGMSPATRSRVFEPFFTTKEVDAGSGLGLSTVYGIVKQMRGAISVESAVDIGTTFRVLLPVTAAEVSAIQDAGDTLPDGVAAVLVVEDDEAILPLIAGWLKDAGYAVRGTRKAAEARDLGMEAPTLDLLVTDVMMPGINGHRLAESLRHEIPDLRVLYISGYAENVLTNGGRLPPGTNFLAKPFTRRQFIDKVEQVLARPTRAIGS